MNHLGAVQGAWLYLQVQLVLSQYCHSFHSLPLGAKQEEGAGWLLWEKLQTNCALLPQGMNEPLGPWDILHW